MMYKISEETLNALLNYLSTRPYKESALLIESIYKLEKLKEDDNGMQKERREG